MDLDLDSDLDLDVGSGLDLHLLLDLDLGLDLDLDLGASGADPYLSICGKQCKTLGLQGERGGRVGETLLNHVRKTFQDLGASGWDDPYLNMCEKKTMQGLGASGGDPYLNMCENSARPWGFRGRLLLEHVRKQCKPCEASGGWGVSGGRIRDPT